jgi:hypothetical protein
MANKNYEKKIVASIQTRKREANNLTQDRNEQIKLEFTGKQKFSLEGCICGSGDYT